MIGTPIGTTILIPLGALILTILVLYSIAFTLLKKGVGIRS